VATAVRTYFSTLRTLANALGLAMGSDITALPKDVRVGDAACGAAPAAVLCRVLVDKGLITNTDLQAGVAAAQAEITAGTWPDEPI
jgi:hypothetical protein